jgi:signal peptidase I
LRKVARFFWRPRPKGESSAPVNTLREVLETLVFVVVLVLLLKTFVAEAFVIPTGSMATTLYGYNKEVTCPQCGFTFHVNCSEEVEKKERGRRLTECECQNCRYRIKFTVEGQPGDIPDPSPGSGDRVLVAKFLADLDVMPLHPLDVVVFKFPEEPVENHVPKNFIKRLIGLSDQVIGIYYGDIYVASREDLEKLGVSLTLDDYLKEIKAKVSPDRWDDVRAKVREPPLRRQMLKNMPRVLELLESGHPCFQILRKPPDKILALLRSVYDNDHPARDLVAAGFPPRWAAESDNPAALRGNIPEYYQKRQQAGADAWKMVGPADGEHGFQCGSRQDGQVWLRYRHLLPGEDRRNPGADENAPAPTLITDFLSYNSDPNSNSNNSPRWVGDVILECEVRLDKAQGELALELCKGPDRFQARWDLTSGLCSLRRNGKELASHSTAMSKPGTYRLRFANVDRRLTVWVDNGLPFDDGVAYDAPTEPLDGKNVIVRRPTSNDLEPAGIGVRGGADLSVHHLKLGRDTYYLSDHTNYDDTRYKESVDENVLKDPAKWPSLVALKGLTMYVQPGHYLCLGDNSPSSSDSRLWGTDERGGLVPERLMLGRALAIYFPFYRFGRIK